MTQHNRRSFLTASTLGAIGAALGRGGQPPSTRMITSGPACHWFGYYDKLQFDPSSRYVLGMQVGFEHRSPRPDDVIRTGMVDLYNGDLWKELGTSRSWGWQQGCMLQWIPGSSEEVLWNDREGGRFVCHVMNVFSGEKRTLPAAVYALSPDGKWAVTTDFNRLNDTRPGYGYAGLPDPNKDRLAPEDSGLWKVDLATGQRDLIFSYADAAKIPYESPKGVDISGAKNGVNLAASKHWFNHLLVSPDGSRFIFLHRWRAPGDRAVPHPHVHHQQRRHETLRDRPLRAARRTSSGATPSSRPRLGLAPVELPKTRFYLYHDKTRPNVVEAIGPGRDDPTTAIAPTCPGNKWILNDTYPDKQRFQNPYLYEVATGRRVPLGHFYSPPVYTGEWRCDLHPRFSPDGHLVCIDSPHADGRQMHLIDISEIVG